MPQSKDIKIVFNLIKEREINIEGVRINKIRIVKIAVIKFKARR